MKSSRTIAVLVGVLSAGALMFSAHSVFAAITWGGGWSAEQPQGTPSYCSANWAGDVAGGSEINGNDSGQAVAWCWNGSQYFCGSTPGWTYYVRARGRDAITNTLEYTPSSYGPTVGSAAGGTSHEFHQCQKGYQAS